MLWQPTSLFGEQGREEDAQCRSMSELLPARCPLRAPVSPTKRSYGGVKDVQRYKWLQELFPPLLSLATCSCWRCPQGRGGSGGTSHCWGWGRGEEQGGHRSGC